MKIKEIKIVNQDESTEIADIGADAINVDYNDTTVKAELDKLGTDNNTNKSNITNLQSQVSGLASGSPKGVYGSVSALTSANPDTGVYVVTGNGHIYSWTKNGTNATDLGVYQATGIEDKSVTIEKTNFIDRYNFADLINGVTGKYNNHTLNHSYGEYVNEPNYYAGPIVPVNENETFIGFSNQNRRLYVYINFYNSEKKLIQTEGGYNLITTSPQNAKYMSFDINISRKTELVILKNNYIDTEIGNIDFNTQFTNILPKTKLKYRDTDFVKKYNIVNTTNFLLNKKPDENIGTSTMFDDTNNSDGSSTYPVYIGDCQEISYFTDAYMRVLFYNENYILLNVTEITRSSVKGKITLPTGTKYFKVYVVTANINKFTFVKGDEIPDRLINYNEYYINLKEVNDLKIKIKEVNDLKIKINDLEKFTLNNKSILWSGDSIAKGEGNNSISYADIISQNNNMTFTKYTISGSTVSKRQNQTNSILERISTMSDNADYVIFEGGWNDMYNVPLGTISDGFDAELNEYEWSGALESLIKQSLVKWKSSKLGFILPHGQTGLHRTTQNQYWDRAIEIFNKWHFPFIDLRHNGLCAFNDELKTEYFDQADGVHPNQKGYTLFYNNQIDNWIKSL